MEVAGNMNCDDPAFKGPMETFYNTLRNILDRETETYAIAKCDLTFKGECSIVLVGKALRQKCRCENKKGKNVRVYSTEVGNHLQ